MGRQSEAIINHFSHPHPLHLTNPQSSRCSACKQTLETEPIYTCRSPSCTTALHLKCSQLPPRITHPCHLNHPLSLIPKSPNPNGVFTCQACGTRGDGFSYSCKDCDLNIHVVCASLPLFLSHRSHCHQLKLVFLPPYGSNAFSCDVCGVIGGSKCWLYRCGLCGFDAHLTCATSNAQVVAGGGRYDTRPENLLLNPINNQRHQFPQGMMGYGGGNRNNQFPQTLIGGGGGGGNRNNQFPQALMGGGGGGGMNAQILQALMGGRGGSSQLLQTILGGGGGGGGFGMDFGQALLNGSNGGIGGLDLSSVLGNVGDFGGLIGGGFGF